MKNNSALERLYNGIIKENPTLVLILGMCPTLAVTTSAINGAGMGLSTTVVLMFSNMISILRNFIPDSSYSWIHCNYRILSYSSTVPLAGLCASIK